MSSKAVILLAMHGMPPDDFPKKDLAEWGKLHSTLNQLDGEDRAKAGKRYLELDAKIRSWPRTPENDLYHKASYDLARELKSKSGREVIVGFNEFCNPTLENGFETAAKSGASQVTVVTPMMTRGGSHSERDIPQAIAAARKKYPALAVEYAWPFDGSKIAAFLADQIVPYLAASK